MECLLSNGPEGEVQSSGFVYSVGAGVTPCWNYSRIIESAPL